MVQERVLFAGILLCITLGIYSGSCSSPKSLYGSICFTVEKNGTFLRTDGFPGITRSTFVPWPRQIRVTDIVSFQGRVYLAVNGCGIAEAVVKDNDVSLVTQYRPDLFQDRTATCFFPYLDTLFCHVYFDTSFSGQIPVTSPEPRFGLVSISRGTSGLEYEPLALLFHGKGEAWEVVGAGALDQRQLLLEWKLAEPEQSRFRYSTYNLDDGSEEEKSREWFYEHAVVEPLTAESDPVCAALMTEATRRLISSAPGCVILFTIFNRSDGGDRRFLVRDNNPAKKETSVYSDVKIWRIEHDYAMLFEDGRFIISHAAQPEEWEKGRLPELPPGCRYTVLALHDRFLCAAWEQVDFFRVGQSGIVFYTLSS
jgi:hypothetical protein